ncbi:MAG: GNAT family N-acetyltransferase [Anaerolineae bacterium]|nr:GNAT family N-acetyltransferase [Anaerolineae bacterium]
MITIRPATTTDIDTLTRMRVDFMREMKSMGGFDEDVFVEATRRYFEEKLPTGEYAAWLAEADGEIVGTSGAVFWQRPPTPKNMTGCDAYILNVYTLPAWRRKGIGKRLMEAVLDAAKAAGVGRAWLRATKDGEPLYRKLGFEPIEPDAMELNYPAAKTG